MDTACCHRARLNVLRASRRCADFGWEIVSGPTDWWVNPGGTLERACCADRVSRKRPGATRQRNRGTARRSFGRSERRRSNAQFQVIGEADAAITRAAAGPPPLAGDAHEVADEPAGRGLRLVSIHARRRLFLEAPAPKRDRRCFQVSQPTDAVPHGAISADLFYEPSYDTVLQPMVEWVVQHEGAGCGAGAAHRARAHGFQREAGFRIGWSRSPGVCLERQRKPEARSIGRAV